MNNLVLSRNLGDLKRNLRQRYSFIEKPSMSDTNSYGFRFNEPQKEVDITYYGCSYTYGEYINADDCWTAVVDKTLNLTSNNFGMPGASIDEILFIFAATIKFFKTKKAVFLLPVASRQNIAVQKINSQTFRYLTVFNNYKKYEEPTSLKYRLSDLWFRLPAEYYVDNAASAIGLIELIAQLSGIKIYWSSWDEEVYNLLPNPKTTTQFVSDAKAADNIHPGVDAHCAFAQQIIELVRD